MANPFEYIVYEPDQVLTNEHLNETFNYLDQQNRWTRNKLIGIGIVCGLDIVLNPGVIEVTKGCGITSQGYLISQDTANYTYYIPYSPVGLPDDLPFTHSNMLPFYAPFCDKKKVWLLITDDQYKALESTQQLTAVTISSATNFLLDYVVVLFLEAKETSLKNCNMQDCNNTGATMDFAIKPLLVAINDLPAVLAGSTGKPEVSNKTSFLAHQVNLKRYNVPYTTLNNSDDVLNAFAKLVDDTTLTQVSNAYNYGWQKYGGLVNVAANPFATLLNDLKHYRDLILKKSPLFIQYFYDFIDDLTKAWYEFSVKVSDIDDTCCPDENLFPLHLVLGSASSATDPFSKDDYRDYFMYSGLFTQLGGDTSGAVLLFNRMVIMVNKFTIQSQQLQLQAVTKITPSQYEYPWLSERAIPYYYQVNAAGAELYKYWNFHKTSHGSAAFNLGYNSNLYNSNVAVTQPLLYDVEYNNFFRIEGFIGQNYNTVLTNLLNQRANYNLPFDVVAVSADQLTTGAVLPDCNMNDLETDFKLIISEAACKIHTIFCFISKLPYRTAAAERTKKAETNLFEVPRTVNLKYSAFKLEAENIDLAVLSTSTVYKKGDFMKQFCPPAANTIGSAYLKALSASGIFTNPVQVNASNSITGVYYYLFEFINAVEELMYEMKVNSLAQLDMVKFNLANRAYLRDTALVMMILAELTTKAATNAAGAGDTAFVTLAEDTQLDLLVDELGLLVSMCIYERVQVLEDEYTDRLTKYQQQLNFLNYYKKHPGLEHKAGVPKGGTFVLVYHTEPSVTTGPGGPPAIVATEFNNDRERAASHQAEERGAARAAAAEVEEDNTVRMIKSYLKDQKATPEEIKLKIFGLLERAGTSKSATTTITDGAVIADFYIPYLCCSDCPPVAYILPKPTTPPPTKPVVTMGTIFCDNDGNAEKITALPAGGTFNTVKGLDPAAPSFTPAKAGAGDYQIIYTLNGVDADPVTVTVLETPTKTAFTVKTEKVDNINKGTYVIFATVTADNANSKYTYTWNFGQGFSLTTAIGPVQHVTIQLDIEGDTKTQVSLTASNGNCDDALVTHNYILNPNGIFPDTSKSEKTLIKGIENLFMKKKKQ